MDKKYLPRKGGYKSHTILPASSLMLFQRNGKMLNCILKQESQSLYDYLEFHFRISVCLDGYRIGSGAVKVLHFFIILLICSIRIHAAVIIENVLSESSSGTALKLLFSNACRACRSNVVCDSQLICVFCKA